MNPIREEADLLFSEAATCHRHRPARRDGLSGSDEHLANRLRAILLGCAALHLTLLSADARDEREVLSRAAFYARDAEIVGEHPQGSVAAMMGLYLKLYRALCPLEIALGVVASEFRERSFRSRLPRFWPSRERIERFDKASDNAIRYAVNFFHRQQLGFPETPTIALLDE